MTIIGHYRDKWELAIVNSDQIAEPLATFMALATQAGYHVTLVKESYPVRHSVSDFVEISTVSSVKALIDLLHAFLRCDIKFITLKKLLNEKKQHDAAK